MSWFSTQASDRVRRAARSRLGSRGPACHVGMAAKVSARSRLRERHQGLNCSTCRNGKHVMVAILASAQPMQSSRQLMGGVMERRPDPAELAVTPDELERERRRTYLDWAGPGAFLVLGRIALAIEQVRSRDVRLGHRSGGTTPPNFPSSSRHCSRQGMSARAGPVGVPGGEMRITMTPSGDGGVQAACRRLAGSAQSFSPDMG